MIAPGRIGRLIGIATLLGVVGAGTALAMGNIAWAGGILLGAFLGLTPFASWAWIASRGLETRRNRIIAALLVLSKLAVYSGTLYLLVTGGRVSPIGVFSGITAAIAVIILGMLIGPAPQAGEAA